MWPLQVERGKSGKGFPDKTKYDGAQLQDVRFSVLYQLCLSANVDSKFAFSYKLLVNQSVVFRPVSLLLECVTRYLDLLLVIGT